MLPRTMNNANDQDGLFDELDARILLDKLLADSRLYRSSRAYMDLLDFVSRMPNIAPFNAMLLQIQKPGLSYATSARDWWVKFGRWPKEGARPLLIMWPFGPVGLVYDVLDTDGPGEPPSTFSARGSVDALKMAGFPPLLASERIDVHWMDQGDYCAGSIRVMKQYNDGARDYRMNVNKNHSTAVQFATLTHELGHLLMGHLGEDKRLRVKDRSRVSKQIAELEAESISYVVCERNGVQSRAEAYLHRYVEEHTELDDAYIYAVMKAAGKIETMLKLAATTRFIN